MRVLDLDFYAHVTEEPFEEGLIIRNHLIWSLTMIVLTVVDGG
jgi:hypothetical protein